MKGQFKIFIHTLVNGRKEIIEESLSPEFMEIQEGDLAFNKPIHIKGSAEVADQTLIIRLHVSTEITIPCLICNEPVAVNLTLPDFCHAEPLSDIRGDIFNFKEVLREAILLETPRTAECEGNCPERKILSKFFKPSANQH